MSKIEELEYVTNQLHKLYESSAVLMAAVAGNHQETLDFCHALRWLLSQTPGSEVFIAGIDKLLIHVEELKQLATSYHVAIGEL